MENMRTARLTTGDRELAKELFAMMAVVFGEKHERLSDAYADRLLSQSIFWAIAAFDGDEIIGGLTAYVLPKTTSESSELFLYDIAVRKSHQRRGVGRLLMTALRDEAADIDIEEAFVLADNDDIHALDFYRALGGRASQVTLFALFDQQK
jgi:aminoglycoside 3-N-acetyltransferase I